MSYGHNSQSRPCEVCGTVDDRGSILRLGQREVALCRRHAARCREAGVQTLSDVRRLFTEEVGSRSLISRRAPDPRRQFPPRPEGRRLGGGRRSSD